MRFRLAFALSVSIMLIGVASWSRFVAAEKGPANLIAVKQVASELNDYDTILEDFTEPKETMDIPSDEPLSNTDLIGHQLILDYIGLAASGGAGTESIDALANKYVESIPTLNRPSVLSYADLKTVTNTKANFQNYADNITKIYRDYKETMEAVGIEKVDIETLNPTLYSSILVFSQTYNKTANELENLPVPGALAQIHLSLINTYIANAEAMKALADAERDSASAFAGLVALNENLAKEQELLNEISRVLTETGI